MFPLEIVISIAAVYLPYYFYRKKKASLVADQKAQLVDALTSRGAIHLGNARVHESVSPSLLSVQKAGANLDIFNCDGSVLIIHQSNWMAMPHLSVTCISKNNQTPSVNGAQHVSPVSVSFRKSALGVNTVQIKGIDPQQADRKLDISLFSMNDATYDRLKTIEIWPADVQTLESNSAH
jgi:hypothetical protein